MSYLCIIKEGMNSYTDSEQKIAKYILKNKDEIINLSAQELAGKINVSAASVVRFSKKVGFKGFTALKVELAKEHIEDVNVDYTEMISTEDNTKVMVTKSINSNINTLNQTYNMINYDNLDKAIDYLKNSKKIYIYGVGASGLVALDLQYKLLRIKKEAIHIQDSHIQMALTPHITSDDVVIGISYRGETDEVNIGVREAKKNGAKVISITKYNNNTLSKNSDVSLFVPNEEGEIRLGAISSRIASLAITDMLYFGIAKERFEETKTYIKETRRVINEIKK